MRVIGLRQAPTKEHKDDEALVSRCLRRDAAAARELFEREGRRVNATLYRVLGPCGEIEDLVQETFLRVFHSLHSFRGEARLSRWIARVAVRVAAQYLESRGPRTVQLELLPDAILASGESPVDRRAIARAGVRRFYEVLERLSPEARIAFTLHVIDGRKTSEVADLMGASGVATRVRIWRARREIERCAADDPLLAAYLSPSVHDEEEP